VDSSSWFVELHYETDETARARVFLREQRRLRLIAEIDGSLRFVITASRFALIRELGPDAAWGLFCSTLSDVERSLL
jgi:hypothetical protein